MPELLGHVVIVGAGFGGLAAAMTLDRRIQVTLIDRRNYHLFAPLLYQVATAALSPADIAEPIRRIVRRRRNVEVVWGEVVGVDTERCSVRLRDGRQYGYGELALSTGSRYSYFGHEDWAARAPGLKTIEDARRVRSSLLKALELAESEIDPDRRRALASVAIVGGGPTGVELAGAIAELTRHALRREFRHLKPEDVSVALIEAGPRLLAGFPERLSRYATRRLEALGVTVLLGRKVEEVGLEHVTVDGQRIAAATILWAAGVRGSDAGHWLGVETDRTGRIPVAPDLSVIGCEHVYAMGDTATMTGQDGAPLPGLAQVAKQQGQYLGRALSEKMRRGVPMPPFRFHNRGNAGIIGRNAAFFDFGRWQLTGHLAWLLWAIIHVWLLVGFEHRLLVTIQWLWRYFTYEGGARLIVDDPPR